MQREVVFWVWTKMIQQLGSPFRVQPLYSEIYRSWNPDSHFLLAKVHLLLKRLSNTFLFFHPCLAFYVISSKHTSVFLNKACPGQTLLLSNPRDLKRLYLICPFSKWIDKLQSLVFLSYYMAQMFDLWNVTLWCTETGICQLCTYSAYFLFFL